jgi:hypothetical protein
MHELPNNFTLSLGNRMQPGHAKLRSRKNAPLLERTVTGDNMAHSAQVTSLERASHISGGAALSFYECRTFGAKRTFCAVGKLRSAMFLSLWRRLDNERAAIKCRASKRGQFSETGPAASLPGYHGRNYRTNGAHRFSTVFVDRIDRRQRLLLNVF